VVAQKVFLEDMEKHHTEMAAVVDSSEEADSALPPPASCPTLPWSCLCSACGPGVASATVGGHFVHVRKRIGHRVR
jgi:hypothetical protein